MCATLGMQHCLIIANNLAGADFIVADWLYMSNSCHLHDTLFCFAFVFTTMGELDFLFSKLSIVFPAIQCATLR